MATRMQQRRGTSAQWAAANPVLADGEIGFDKTTGVVKMGNGTSTWNTLPAILDSYFLPVGGKAYDADRLDGLDGTAYAQKAYVDGLILPAGASRQIGIHYGAVTTFPATSLRAGDRCYRTDLFCEFLYNGAVWRQTSFASGTSAQRAAISTGAGTALYVGFEFFETDTLFFRRWDGTRWEIVRWHGDRSGTGSSVAGAMVGLPGMSAIYVGASISNGVGVTYNNWTTVATLPAVFATSGDGGVPLIQYAATGSQTLTCRAKGRVRVDLFATCDHGSAGRNDMNLVTNANFGVWSKMSDTRQRNSGYGGAGVANQLLSLEYPVNPGDWFSYEYYQTNAGSTALGLNSWLQVVYI